jgi:AraC family transcriptional regulator
MADLPNLAKAPERGVYLERINRAIDHVMRHVGEPLPLEEVAAAACFSPFHFHSIFRALVGETVHDLVKRVRLERALQMLSHREKISLTEVALACGFSSSSDFSRAFRGHFGMPPRVFDVQRSDGFQVRLRDVPARRVAYLRALRPYQGDGVVQAAARLVAWARQRALAGGQWLGYQWEDPEIVALDLCRYDVGLEVPPGTVVDGGVGIVDFPAMKLAEVDVAGPIELEMRAIDWLYTTWLPASGYVPDHQPGFEAWKGKPFAHGDKHFELTVQLAVVDAATAW